MKFLMAFPDVPIFFSLPHAFSLSLSLSPIPSTPLSLLAEKYLYYACLMHISFHSYKQCKYKALRWRYKNYASPRPDFSLHACCKHYQNRLYWKIIPPIAKFFCYARLSFYILRLLHQIRRVWCVVGGYNMWGKREWEKEKIGWDFSWANLRRKKLHTLASNYRENILWKMGKRIEFDFVIYLKFIQRDFWEEENLEFKNCFCFLLSIIIKIEHLFWPCLFSTKHQNFDPSELSTWPTNFYANYDFYF